jgi:hypothetical protein
VTIAKGTPWGREVERPTDLVIVDDDRAAVIALTDRSTLDAPSPHVALRGGDLARTLGASGPRDRQRLNELPIDLLEVRLDDAEPVVACAHVVARSPLRRGSWWRGPILAVMNAEFLGTHDVAPRGHPNDGRVETFLVDATMSLRHRLAARRRLATGTHVPHPSITSRSVRTATWSFPSEVEVSIDHRRAGRARTIEVTVRPDAAVVLA